MRTYFVFSIVLFLATLRQSSSSFLANTNNQQTNIKICPINAVCATTAPVCAITMGMNTCVHFMNACRFNEANCVRNNIYSPVALTACANILAGFSGMCVGLVPTTIPANTNKLNGLFGLNKTMLFG